MVVLGQASRGVQQDAPPVRHACQFGLGKTTAEIARFLLERALPDQLESIEFLDIAEAEADDLSALELLRADFGPRRVRIATPEDGGPPVCDAVLFSDASSNFSFERVRPRLGKFVLAAWLPEGCMPQDGDEEKSECAFLNSMWEKTVLMRRGYCMPQVCMSRVPTDKLHDPNVLPLDCEKFLTSEGFNASVSEFGQDWFALWNFLSASVGPEGGVYVDVGACLPFEYSNTVILDRCLKWQGVCVEANPNLVPFLRAYRSCGIYNHCADAEFNPGRTFTDREGEVHFTADCIPLGDILERAQLKHKRIHLLSIDVEHAELRVLQGLPLEDYDIRVIVIEVSRGVRELEVDTFLLPRGYAKVAVLGRDAVYVKLQELQGMAPWPFLVQGGGAPAVLPDAWPEFHQRVLDEELEAEMVREKEALEKGLRRR